MKPFFIRILFTLAAIYGLALIALFTFQRSVLYIPPSLYLTPAGVELSGATEVPLAGKPDEILGWWMPPTQAHAQTDVPVVMFFHGNGSAVYSGHDVYKRLQAEGYGVFALAYPGYPGRAGKTTQTALTQAAVQGYDYLLFAGIREDAIVFYGTSLGAGVAAQLSQQRRPRLLIMEAPFTSAADMAQLRFPIFPAALLTKDKFNSVEAIAGSGIPVLWIHGTQDRVIPFHIGQALYGAYDGPKSPYIIEGGQHTNLWYLGGDDIIVSALRELSMQSK